MPCSNCGAEKVLAKGFCSGCYWRVYRRGTTERAYQKNDGPCRLPGCDRRSFAKGLCEHHYHQQDHPLKNVWKIMRSRPEVQVVPRWNSFKQFLADVGERPVPKSQLRRRDPSLPFGPSNFRWVSPVGVSVAAGEPETAAQEYKRSWRLARKFNLTPADYDRMLAEQGGGCAICGTKASHDLKNGKEAKLAVDHDHASGAVRGLLCVQCNRGLGYFKDDEGLLDKAKAYLRRGVPE